LNAFIVLKSDVFNDGTRPIGQIDAIRGDLFRFAPHYPNQFMKSIGKGKNQWPDPPKHDDGVYHTLFNVRTIEIFRQRSKYNQPCTEGTLEHDDDIIQWITEKIGCKPPFWNSTSAMPLCFTKEELMNTSILLNQIMSGNFQRLNYTREIPCGGLEKYQLGFTDIEVKEAKGEFIKKMTGRDKNTVIIEIDLDDWSYKEVKNVRKMDLQSLIGNINKTFTKNELKFN
jgi:hypothetical protein